MRPRAIAAAALSPATPRNHARAKVAATFVEAGLAGADLDARVLVCFACDIDHAGLVRDPDLPLGDAAARLEQLASRRLAREPVSRILGRREFWGLPFAITPGVLDPRPDTEGVVGAVIDALGGRRKAPLRVLDLGVGSGAILCALLNELPGACGLGVDRSLAACHVARSNVVALGLAIRAAIVCAAWTSAVGGPFDVVVSNPPYIRRDELAGLDREVREHDPLAALDGGDDGLEAFRTIVPELGRLLRPRGIAAFECGHAQGAAVTALLTGVGFSEVRILKDLAGLDRVVVGFRP